MSMLPATIKRVWVVDSYGNTIEHRGPAKALTSGQRHYHYRLGLMAVDQFMKGRGFRCNIEPSQCVLSYEKSGVWIDIRVQRPGNVAYVTSFPGYEYKQEVAGKAGDGQEMYRVRAKVVTMKEIMGSDYVIQIVISTAEGGTHNPMFIPLPKTLDHPAHYVLSNVLRTLALACDNIPSMYSAFTKADVEEAAAKPINEVVDESTLPLLPD